MIGTPLVLTVSLSSSDNEFGRQSIGFVMCNVYVLMNFVMLMTAIMILDEGDFQLDTAKYILFWSVAKCDVRQGIT